MDIDQELAYQKAVKRLTVENKRLHEELRDKQRQHRNELSVLAAQLQEGLSPELITLRRQLTHWRQRAMATEARLREQLKGATG